MAESAFSNVMYIRMDRIEDEEWAEVLKSELLISESTNPVSLREGEASIGYISLLSNIAAGPASAAPAIDETERVASKE